MASNNIPPEPEEPQTIDLEEYIEQRGAEEIQNLRRKTMKHIKKKGTPDNIDKFVGVKVRENRIALGWSQERLAEALGVTFQQVQKYERGVNRLSASRIYQVSLLMGVPMASFYPGKGAAPKADHHKRNESILKICANIRSQRDMKRLKMAVNLLIDNEAKNKRLTASAA